MPQWFHELAAVCGVSVVAFEVVRWLGNSRWGGWRWVGETISGGAAPTKRILTARRLERLERIARKPTIAVADIVMATMMMMVCMAGFGVIVLIHRFPASGSTSLSPADGFTAMLILLCGAACFFRAADSYWELTHTELLIKRARQSQDDLLREQAANRRTGDDKS